MFSVTTDAAADFTVYLQNGDNQNLSQIPEGVVYNDPYKNWLWYFENAVPNNRNVRMNYTVFYNPGSTQN